MVSQAQYRFQEGDRVIVAGRHPWLPQRCGTIKRIENRIGNRLIVKFDTDELGLWHDDDGDPVLRLGDVDLIFVAERLSWAA
ncbi:MAG: hypothetical protein HYV04_18120 [Deltaproteobacteria bacterium]|nr:hypothetical protein [Deltaproteobacteria bacterium]